MKNKIPYVIVLVLIVILAAAYGIYSYSAKKSALPVTVAPTGETKSFDISAKKFEFSPAKITVSRGDKVELNLTSADAIHGFKLDEYDIDKTLQPGKPVKVEFLADKPGTFQFRCSIPCGAGHMEMFGTLNVL